MQGVAGTWYDGRVSQPRQVLLTLEAARGGPRLRVQPLQPGSIALEFGPNEVGWPERWSRRAAQRLVVDLRDAGSVEIDDPAAWQEAAQAASLRATLAERMQTRWPTFLMVALLAIASLWAFARWGTPWAATQLTRQVPLAWETAIAERAMRDLDESLLKPSKLAQARQAGLRARFDALARHADPALARYEGYAPPMSLSFRSGLGANAFALPGGTIVMTDGLVEAAAREGLGDDALAGVLAHEMGHVAHRHTTRLMVEQAVLNVGLGLAIGDVSHVLSIGSSILTGMAYRRGHETEADCYAAALMRKAGLPTAPMADLLLSLDRSASGREGKGAAQGSQGVGDLLSSHPHTAERARALKRGDVEGC